MSTSTFSIAFAGELLGSKIRIAMDANLSLIAQAVTNAARLASAEIISRGRADMHSAGKFGSRWDESLHADVFPKTGALINSRIDVYHVLPGASIFEYGGVIHCKPLLWIPLSYTGLTISAHDYTQRFGALFFVQRTVGAPLLLDIKTHKPKYFGVASVTIHQKFHLRQIGLDVMSRFVDFYNQQFTKG